MDLSRHALAVIRLKYSKQHGSPAAFRDRLLQAECWLRYYLLLRWLHSQSTKPLLETILQNVVADSVNVDGAVVCNIRIDVRRRYRGTHHCLD